MAEATIRNVTDHDICSSCMRCTGKSGSKTCEAGWPGVRNTQGHLTTCERFDKDPEVDFATIDDWRHAYDNDLI